MIRLDSRTGSGELADLFKPYGIRVLKTHLDFGDCDWQGRGPLGECSVVVERKRIDDLVQSMQSRRLSGHQLPGMAERYDYAYLIVEGIWRPGEDGELEVQNWGRWQSRGIHTRAITNYLMGLSLRAGMVVWRTGTDRETVAFVVDQYRMWTEKEWGEHTCHEAVYAPAETGGEGRGRMLTLRPRVVSLAEKVAMQLPGIDYKARAVAKKFGSVRRMAIATEGEWAGLPWVDKRGGRRRLGVETARRIVAAIKGE